MLKTKKIELPNMSNHMKLFKFSSIYFKDKYHHNHKLLKCRKYKQVS